MPLQGGNLVSINQWKSQAIAFRFLLAGTLAIVSNWTIKPTFLQLQHIYTQRRQSFQQTLVAVPRHTVRIRSHKAYKEISSFIHLFVVQDVEPEFKEYADERLVYMVRQQGTETGDVLRWWKADLAMDLMLDLKGQRRRPGCGPPRLVRWRSCPQCRGALQPGGLLGPSSLFWSSSLMVVAPPSHCPSHCLGGQAWGSWEDGEVLRSRWVLSVYQWQLRPWWWTWLDKGEQIGGEESGTKHRALREAVVNCGGLGGLFWLNILVWADM